MYAVFSEEEPGDGMEGECERNPSWVQPRTQLHTGPANCCPGAWARESRGGFNTFFSSQV